MVPDASLLNTHQYKVRIKGKVEQSRERSSTSPTPRCCRYWKGGLLVPLDYGRQLYIHAQRSSKLPTKAQERWVSFIFYEYAFCENWLVVEWGHRIIDSVGVSWIRGVYLVPRIIPVHMYFINLWWKQFYYTITQSPCLLFREFIFNISFRNRFSRLHFNIWTLSELYKDTSKRLS